MCVCVYHLLCVYDTMANSSPYLLCIGQRVSWIAYFCYKLQLWPRLQFTMRMGGVHYMLWNIIFPLPFRCIATQICIMSGDAVCWAVANSFGRALEKLFSWHVIGGNEP